VAVREAECDGGPQGGLEWQFAWRTGMATLMADYRYNSRNEIASKFHLLAGCFSFFHKVMNWQNSTLRFVCLMFSG
jgi:hypothetical protein